MKNPDRYHPAKFLCFDPIDRRKALIKLIHALEDALTDAERREEIKRHLIACVALLEPSEAGDFAVLARELAGTDDPHSILRVIHPWLDQELRDQDLRVLKCDGLHQAAELIYPDARAIIVILDNLRSVFNVGSIFRTAECLALGGVWLCGITPTPAHPAMKKTSRDTCERVAWQHFDSTNAAVLKASAEGYRVCALETVSTAISVYDYAPKLPLALVIGNEALGISADVLKLCEEHIHLPVQGWKNSLNVGVAFAVAAYQLLCGKSSKEKNL
ncbi:MAG: TrmH family RNA methyltransferase [Candidatus Cloacimonadaceae bacterium]|nr:TrmH family RNA methyltransferase [Candidatus Cloacimonadaceae bacterium]